MSMNTAINVLSIPIKKLSNCLLKAVFSGKMNI